MDIFNSQIGQGVARDSASAITDKTFATSNMIGQASGVSLHTKSENSSIFQQVKNTEKTQVNLSNPTLIDEQKKLKANIGNADNSNREEKINFSQSFSGELDKANEFLQTSGTKISFSLDENADSPIVIVSDKESGNVIRQIPSEEMLKFAERVKEFESASASEPTPIGMILDRQA